MCGIHKGKEYIRNIGKHRREIIRDTDPRRPPHWGAAEGGTCVSVNFLIILYHRYLWIFLISSLYIPYLFPSYVKYVSLVCFLIYVVKRRQVLIPKPRYYFYFFRFHTFYSFIRNFLKKSVLDPKRAKSDQNSDLGHVRTYS